MINFQKKAKSKNMLPLTSKLRMESWMISKLETSQPGISSLKKTIKADMDFLFMIGIKLPEKPTPSSLEHYLIKF